MVGFVMVLVGVGLVVSTLCLLDIREGVNRIADLIEQRTKEPR